MEKTSIYFNDKRLVRETGTVQEVKKTNSGLEKELFCKKPKPEKGDIPFEPPRDDDENRPAKGDIKFEEPIEPTIEDRLEQIERGQGQIIMMLQTLLNIASKDIE